MHVAVIIPVYNERPFLPTLIDRLDRTPPPIPPRPAPRGPLSASPTAESFAGAEAGCRRTLILIDDGSTDGSTGLVRSLAERADVHAIFHAPNAGKGAAIAAGVRAAAHDLRVDAAIIQDADLEYHPADHRPVLAPILSGEADAVIGSRFIGETHRVLYYWHSVANRAITTASNMLSNLNLTDIECGFKAFSRPVLEALEIRERAFGVEPEIVAKLARMRSPAGTGPPRPIRIYETPVSYAGRTYAEGKKITWRDGFAAMRCIVRYNLLERSRIPVGSVHPAGTPAAAAQ